MYFPVFQHFPHFSHFFTFLKRFFFTFFSKRIFKMLVFFTFFSRFKLIIVFKLVAGNGHDNATHSLCEIQFLIGKLFITD